MARPAPPTGRTDRVPSAPRHPAYADKLVEFQQVDIQELKPAPTAPASRGRAILTAVTAAPRLHYTYQEYVAFERTSDVKHEFVRGVILAMAGGKPEHGARAVRLTTALTVQLAGRPCNVFDSDVRVRIRGADVSAYPDASVVCGRLETDT